MWLPSLDQVGCVEGVALITGGYYSKFIAQVEVYGPDELKYSLSNLPQKIREHSVDYIDGSVFLCGGQGNKNLCLKGEYQAWTKGSMSLNRYYFIATSP